MQGEFGYRGYVIWFDGAMWVAELKAPHLDVVEEMGSTSFDNLVRMIDQLDACAAVSTFDSVKMPNWYRAWLDAGQKGRIMDPFAKITSKFFVKASEITAIKEIKKPRNFEVPGVDPQTKHVSTADHSAKLNQKTVLYTDALQKNLSIIAQNASKIACLKDEIDRIRAGQIAPGIIKIDQLTDVARTNLSDRIIGNSIDYKDLVASRDNEVSTEEMIKAGSIRVSLKDLGRITIAGGAVTAAGMILGPGAATMLIAPLAAGIASRICTDNGIALTRGGRIAPSTP